MSRSPRALRHRPRLHDKYVPYYHHLGRRSPPTGHRTLTTWTVMDFINTSVGWVSRLPWELQPRPLIGDSPELVPEPFRGRLLCERFPSERPPVYTPEEARILCPLCRVLEISRRAHHAGSLHRARLAAAVLYQPGLQPPVPDTVEAAIALLRSLRPHLLRDEVLDEHQEHPPGTEALVPLEPQAPLEDLISLDLDP
ncbi:hypothetical protein HPB49_016309 [Dermacentor silvarum]|uniref:Uncharacterized protein n=2 Tax=Dermacentor silvarum TaxID=543639 RepID=A0ACB8CLX0_DERSI|nr:hypothetical protein HPB49_016309 [Dermacentor silvarum]